MKKSIFIFALILLCILPSCSFSPLLPKDDAPENNPEKAAFLSSMTMFSDFFFDAYSSGTELKASDFEAFCSLPLRKDNAHITVNSLSVLGRELASKDKELSLSFTSLKDNEKELSHKSTNVTYGSEKLSAVLFSSKDSSLAAFSCLADTYVEFPSKVSIKNTINEFLSSDAISADRFSVSRTDCRYGEAVIKYTQKITLDLEGADLSPLLSDIFEYIDPLFRLSDEKEYILNNLSSPPGTRVSVYIKDGSAVCAEAFFTVGGTEHRATVFFNSSESYQCAKISFTKSSSPSRNIFSLDFVQSINGTQKSGTVSVSFFPKELFKNSYSLPSSINFDAEYNTTISQTRQNCTMNAELEYTLFGITSSYKLPISIVTELLDRDFSVSISLSAENAEISELDTRISLTMSALESLEVPVIFNETVTPVQTKEQADEFLTSFFSGFEKKYPNLRYLIFKNYGKQEGSPLSIITAKNKKIGETFIIQINDIASASVSGNGEYIKEFSYTESGDTVFVAEHSEKDKYTFNPSSAEKTVLEDGSLMFTEKDDSVWRFFPASMTGYFSKPVTLYALIDDSGLSGEFSIYFSDSSALHEKASFYRTGSYVSFANNKYEYYIY